MSSSCKGKVEVFSRVVGFYSITRNWNKGKKEEFKIRKTFKLEEKEKTAEEVK
jgi:ribonucleoside-triphosphate reductase